MTLRHLRTSLGWVAVLLALSVGDAAATDTPALIRGLARSETLRDSVGAPGPPRVALPEAGTDDLRGGRGLGLAADKWQHASLSFSAGLGVGLVTKEPAAAVGGALLLGVTKELFDPRFDRGDLVADVVGATLAALLTHALAR